RKRREGGFYIKFYLPKTPKGKVGIILGIFSENEAEHKKIKNDLILRVQEDIEAAGFGDIARVIVMPNHISKNIQSPMVVRKMNKKARGNFWIWGYTRTRNGKTYIDLEGLVAHRPVDKSTSIDLGRDFRSALPKRFEFDEAASFKASEMAGDMIVKVAQYIIGIAAYISGVPNFAIQLHTALARNINAMSPIPPNLITIQKKIPTLISNEYLAIAIVLAEEGKTNEAEEWLAKAQDFKADNYGVWLLKAMLEFSIRNNASESLKHIEVAEKYAGSHFEWKYSKAFLLLWLGRYNEALAICRKIARQDFPGEGKTIEAVELFNQQMISSGRARPETYFWLGYLNYKKKANLALGLQHFEDFAKRATPAMAPLIAKASPYIDEIKREIGVE
ncbi:hypothetical protein KW791_04140, partial [Candidatus Parcubacteria bacterium]|nr:hypothetical protein [Candidatus Parcubacteria bacterium]